MQDREFRELIERVKLRTPIEVVVGERVPDLVRRGSAWKARCPFHDEKTPSFTVNPERGTWRCFGACSEGGDVISFVQKFEGLSFLEALRVLAEACGEEMPTRVGRREPREADERRSRLHDALERAQKLYARTLRSDEGRPALDYLLGRGLSEGTLSAFGVGFAPRHGNGLCQAARASEVPEELLIETGLAKRADDGRVFDFFRGRLMIPIRDSVGRTVGFGGRLLPGEEGPKYVNTGETELFKKSRLIYGLDLALPAVRKTKHLALMEGYTDVMAAHQVGVTNVAAVLGTATTEEHAALVRRSGAKRVTLLFDGDEAGDRAGLRAVEHLLPLGVEIDVVVLPPGTDPCDLCLSEGSDALNARFAEARDWFAHGLEGLRGLAGPRQAEEVDELLKLLLRLSKPVEVDLRVKEMADFLGIPEEGIRAQGREVHRRQKAQRASRARAAEIRREAEAEVSHAPPAGHVDDEALIEASAEAVHGHESEARPPDARLVRAFEALLGAALCDASLLPRLRARRPACPPGPLQSVFDALLYLWDEGDEDTPIDEAAVISVLADDPARDRVISLAEAARRAESPLVLARDQLAWLERRDHEEEIRNNLDSLRSAASLEDESTREALRRLHAELRDIKVPAPEVHDAASGGRG